MRVVIHTYEDDDKTVYRSFTKRVRSDGEIDDACEEGNEFVKESWRELQDKEEFGL